MASKLGSADPRPRIYVRQAMDGRAVWRQGVSGLESEAPDVGAAVNRALAALGMRPAVIIWEGPTDGL